MIYTYIALGFLYVLLLIVAVMAWGALRRSPIALATRLNEMEAEMGNIVDAQASLAKSFKRLNARLAGRARLEQRDEREVNAANSFAQQRGESVAEWKARCRQMIAQRKVPDGHYDQVE